MRLVSYLLVIIWIIGFPYAIKAQPSVALDSARGHLRAVVAQMPSGTTFKIRDIKLRGNRLTKDYIILRECPLKTGASITTEEMYDVLETTRLNIVNTQLFLEVFVGIDKWENQEVDLVIDLKERWYIFPLPYFKLIDRNLNQWLVEQNGSLERANYGMKFLWENVSGRRDRMYLHYVNGYSRQYSLFYEQPYADKSLEKGFLAGLYYIQTRQMPFATDSNKQIFFPADNGGISSFVRKTFKAEVGFTIRKGVNHRHSFRLNYVYEQVPDTLFQIAEEYAAKGYLPFFNDRRSRQRFGEFVYTYQYFDVNNIAYPWKGVAFAGAFTQRGLGMKGMNLWQFSGKVGRYFQVQPKLSVSLMGYGLLKLPFRQPMYNMGAMGYGDFMMRGLEYYVVDGVMAGMLKTTIRQEILHFSVPTLILKNEKYKKIPFKVVLKVYSDIGASHTPFLTNSYLNNRMLYTYGVGADLLSYYDFIARFEYSFNQLGQKGLFLHMRKDF